MHSLFKNYKFKQRQGLYFFWTVLMLNFILILNACGDQNTPVEPTSQSKPSPFASTNSPVPSLPIIAAAPTPNPTSTNTTPPSTSNLPLSVTGTDTIHSVAPTPIPSPALALPGSRPIELQPALNVPTLSTFDFNTHLKEVDSYIDQLMKLYDIPGAAVGIIDAGKVVYTNGYGVKSTQTQTPIGRKTQFPIGSLTKSFTALAALQLVEQGKLSLNTPIINYWPEFKLADQVSTRQVTLRHLLTHTSGLPRSDSDLFIQTEPNEVLKGLDALPLIGRPGEKWMYSNQGYAIIGVIIERVSGQSWNDYIKTHVLSPLGMSQSSLDIDTFKHSADYITPHLMDSVKGMIPVALVNPAGIAPAAAVNSSIEDMTTYLRFELGDGTLDDHSRLLSSELFEQMHLPLIKLTDFGLYRNLGYGFGWYNVEYRGQRLITHSGTLNGEYGVIFGVPATHSGIVVLTNAPDSSATQAFGNVLGLSLMDKLLNLSLQPDLIKEVNTIEGSDLIEQQTASQLISTYPSVDANESKKWLGSYRPSAASNIKLVITSQNNQLFLEFVPANPNTILDFATTGSMKLNTSYELRPYKPKSFIGLGLSVDRRMFEFREDNKGNTQIYQLGHLFATKLPDQYTGRYSDPNGQFEVEIADGLSWQKSTQAGSQVAIVAFGGPGEQAVLGTTPISNSDLVNTAFSIYKEYGLLPYGANLPTIPTRTETIVNSTDVPTWHEFFYEINQGSLHQTIGVGIAQVKSSNYFILVQSRTDNSNKVKTILDQLIGLYHIIDV